MYNIYRRQCQSDIIIWSSTCKIVVPGERRENYLEEILEEVKDLEIFKFNK